MITPVQSVIDDALRLPESDREEVIVRLLASFDSTAEQEAADDWNEEIRLRVEELRSGKVTPIPWEVVRRQFLEEDESDVG